MSKASKHPFLTFVVSGVAAFVLIGGAFASISAVQKPQDTSTQAYMGAVPFRGGKGDALLCGMTCRTDSECGTGGYCLLGKMLPCPAGKMCAQVMPLGVCRASACSGDTKCSCAPRATMYPRPSMLPSSVPKPLPTGMMRIEQQRAY